MIYYFISFQLKIQAFIDQLFTVLALNTLPFLKITPQNFLATNFLMLLIKG